uniref:QueT transporter family protein n=1 Tax=uncultured Flavonifractor sp. TaxID=1193534 RepID=UPI0026130D98|nr:QueT transporter family protein [uncultured Flavonifractor sp.]
MRKFTTRDLTLAAMVAALYAVLGYFGNVFGLTFGAVQIRFSEALTVLPFLFPATAPGLTLGCLITNVLSPYGPIDMIMGTLATGIAAWLTVKMPRWYLAALPPVLVNMVILAPMWSWSEVGAINNAFWAACAFNAGTFVIGELAACYILGTVLLLALPKIRYFRGMIPERRLAGR